MGTLVLKELDLIPSLSIYIHIESIPILRFSHYLPSPDRELSVHLPRNPILAAEVHYLTHLFSVKLFGNGIRPSFSFHIQDIPNAFEFEIATLLTIRIRNIYISTKRVFGYFLSTH